MIPDCILSTPIYLRGRHRGAVRIGYSTGE